MVLLAKSLLTALMLTASNISFASDLDIRLPDGFKSIRADKYQEMMADTVSINTVKNITICQAMMSLIDQSQPSDEFDKEKFHLACIAYGFLTKWHQDFPEYMSETDDAKAVSSTPQSEKVVNEGESTDAVRNQSEPSKPAGYFRWHRNGKVLETLKKPVYHSSPSLGGGNVGADWGSPIFLEDEQIEKLASLNAITKEFNETTVDQDWAA